MQDLPTASELLLAVREFLEQDVFPEAEGRKRFHTRVAMNALAILDRELRLGPGADAAERARLAALLPGGADADASLTELNERLAAAIRDGGIDPASAPLLKHLRATARDKLAIANPRYLRD